MTSPAPAKVNFRLPDNRWSGVGLDGPVRPGAAVQLDGARGCRRHRIHADRQRAGHGHDAAGLRARQGLQGQHDARDRGRRGPADRSRSTSAPAARSRSSSARSAPTRRGRSAAGPRDALADARHAGDVRRVHARRRARVHGDHHRQRRLERGRRHADRLGSEHAEPGRLVNGSVRRSRSRCRASAIVKTYAAPVSNDAVTVTVQAGDRRHRRASHGHLREDADLHAVDYRALVTAVEPQSRTGLDVLHAGQLAQPPKPVSAIRELAAGRAHPGGVRCVGGHGLEREAGRGERVRLRARRRSRRRSGRTRGPSASPERLSVEAVQRAAPRSRRARTRHRAARPRSSEASSVPLASATCTAR